MTPDFLDFLPMGAFIIDRDYTVRKWNRVIEEWSRVPRGEIEGKPLGEKFKRFDEPRYRHAIENCLDNNTAPVLFSPALHKDLLPTFKPDGSKRIQVISISPIARLTGSVQGFVTIQDITDLTQANKKIREAQIKIEREIEQRIAAEKMLSDSKKQEALSKLASGFAHVVNNKLQAISSAAEIAAAKLNFPEKVQNQIERILAISKKTGELSNLLWEFAQENSESSERIPIFNCIAKIAEEFEASNRIGVFLETASPEKTSALHVTFSQKALFLIFKEVLSNAFEAFAGTASPMIRIVIHEAAHSEGSQNGDGEFAVVSVHDNGEGMSAETMAHAFDPFFTQRENRNGIGLTIAREKALQFRGDLILQSIEGQGTEVRILLPVDRNGPSPPELSVSNVAIQKPARRHVLEGFVSSLPGEPTLDGR